MTSKEPKDPGHDRKVPKAERSVDFGARLAEEARKRVRESARREADKPLETPASPIEDLPRERVTVAAAPLARHAAVRARRPLRVKLLVLALSCLGSLLAVELGARLFLVEPEQIRGRTLAAHAFYESLRYPVPGEMRLKPPYRTDRTLGFCYVRDFDGVQTFEEAPTGQYRLLTNALGLRDERALVPKDPSTLRILVVGDSMTFGHGVEREQAFPAVLERVLGAELGRPLDVVNAGVMCWGQREEVAFLEHRAPDLAPDFVVLELTIANDILDNLRYLEEAGDLIPDPQLGADLSEHPLFELPFAETSRAWRLFTWHVGRHIVRYRAMLEPRRLERTRLLLRRARDAAARLHARFGIVIAPTVVQVDDGPTEAILRTRRINTAIARMAAEDGIEVYDPMAALKSARAKGARTYFPKDLHWNATGHEVVGQGLAEWLLPRMSGR